MKLRDQLLTLLGMGALLVYVLACRPAFSPDGKKVLFPTLDPQTKQSSIWLYDRDQRRMECVFMVPTEDQDEDGVLPTALWMPDGKEAVVCWPVASNALRVAVLPLGSRQPTRMFLVPETKDVASQLINPPPIIGRHLFIGGDRLARLNLDSGKIDTVEVEQQQFYLTAQGNRIYYLMSQEPEERVEVGKLEPEHLSWIRLFRLAEDQEVAEGCPFLAVTKDGRGIALVLEQEVQISVAIYRDGELAQRIPVGNTNAPVRLGNLVWSRDERSLYTAAFREGTEKGSGMQVSLMEIPLAGGAPRETPVFRAVKSAEQASFVHQIALDPRGRTVAFSGACDIDDWLKPEDRALYLIDVSRAKRPVTKLTWSKPPADAKP